MIVTDKQIREGIYNYITNVMITNVPVQIKIPLSVVANGIRYNDNFLQNLLSNPIIASFIPHTDKGYDLDILYKSLSEALKQYGNYTISFLKSDFTFTAQDVELLKAEIEKVGKNG